jgi:hypothetical protein
LLAHHQISLLHAIGEALTAAGYRHLVEVPLWPADYDPYGRAHRDAQSGSLPSDPCQYFDRLTVPGLSCWPAAWPSARRAYRELVELIERARDRVARAELAPDEVRAMLAETRTPMPVANGLTVLAANCLTLALREAFDQAPPSYWSARKRGWRKVNAAVETLRQLLPEVIKELEDYGYARRIPPIRQVLKPLDKLDLTMPNLAPARRPWAKGAVWLAKTYIKTVDPGAGWSREGPAVRFLALALSRAYREEISAAAIATELDRHRDEIFSLYGVRRASHTAKNAPTVPETRGFLSADLRKR